MKRVSKIAIVLGGYLLAVLAAYGAVVLNEARLRALPEPASDGMAAFGDLILFVFVFGLAALLPTGAALFFLLGRRKRHTRSLS